MIRVAVVDDHSLVREGLRSVFARTEDIRMVEDYSDGDELIGARPSRRRIDVIVLDISMARSDGISVLNQLRSRDGAPPVLILTLHPETSHAEAAIRAGARGYLTKSAPNEQVCDAIRVVARGGLYLTENGTTEVLNPQDPEALRTEQLLGNLSPQERKVFEGICAGNTQKEIAWQMGVSEQTVSTYKRRLMTKLGVSSVADIVRMGFSLEKDADTVPAGRDQRTQRLR